MGKKSTGIGGFLKDVLAVKQIEVSENQRKIPLSTLRKEAQC